MSNNIKEVILPSGEKRFEIVTDGPINPLTGHRKQIKRRGKTKKEVKEKIRQALIKLSEDKNMPVAVGRKIDKLTFEDVAHEWLDIYRENAAKKSTVRVREKQTKSLIKYMGDYLITRITFGTYQKELNKMSKEYAYNTLDGINSTAGMIFKFAIREGIIKINPRQDAKIPKQRKTVEQIKEDPIEEKYLNADELQDLFQTINRVGLPLDKETFSLLLFSGMRSGEMCALQKQDLDFKEKRIHIYKTLYTESGGMDEYEITPPKTTKSVRFIEMDDDIMSMLKKLVLKNDQNKLAVKTIMPEYHDKDFLFARTNGYPFDVKHIGKRMKRLVNQTKITKTATPHIFRHTHISMMTEAGFDLPTIMDRVGHDDMDTTMKIYTHVTNKMKKEAPVRIANLYGDLLNVVSE